MQEKAINPETVLARNLKTTMMKLLTGLQKRVKRLGTILLRKVRKFTDIHNIYSPSIPMAEKNDLKSFKCQFESDLGEVLALF